MNQTRRTHQSRQRQLVALLDRDYALSVRQLSKKMKVSETSIRSYLSVLLKYKVVELKYKLHKLNSKKPINLYSTTR
jgi:DeoR/GlpR family transcriptional regulator of sugar metabolism